MNDLPPRPRILLFGRDGQIGWELRRTLSPLGEIVAPDRDHADFAKPEALRPLVREIRPAWIVNAAAYTAVDKAESEPDLARLINAVAPGVLAEEAAHLGAALIHYSTDYVFDGTKAGPYTEEDVPNPLNVYGATKLAGEQAIRAANCRRLILRTSWVYGARGSNFLLTMLRLARERDELRVVDDQIGAPTWCRAIAEATAALVARLQSGAPQAETYHLTCGGGTSWHGFAARIFAMAGVGTRLLPIASGEYRCVAQRPRNSLLSNDKLRQAFGIALPGWVEALALCWEEMRPGSSNP